MKNAFFGRVYSAISEDKPRSAWGRGVQAYALELVEQLDDADVDTRSVYDWGALKSAMLNGARDWVGYSWGGHSLIYDADIAERLCCPSELKRCRGGERRPNAREYWLDTQARALHQAAGRVGKAVRVLAEEREL